MEVLHQGNVMQCCGQPMTLLKENTTDGAREKHVPVVEAVEGGYRVTVEKARVCDYLGLFSFRVRKCREQTVLVRPKSQAVEDLVDPRGMEINAWVPKPGGGYAENHEHRLYRPGDNLNQLHWKLSAKVGDLILREPMEPVQGAVLLTVLGAVSHLLVFGYRVALPAGPRTQSPRRRSATRPRGAAPAETASDRLSGPGPPHGRFPGPDTGPSGWTPLPSAPPP